MKISQAKNRLRWWARQKIAAPERFYGDGGTIHATPTIDVEIFEGKIVSVWFRCQILPFTQREVDRRRATEMGRHEAEIEITGLTIRDLD
jgi:hypothetical protein